MCVDACKRQNDDRVTSTLLIVTKGYTSDCLYKSLIWTISARSQMYIYIYIAIVIVDMLSAQITTPENTRNARLKFPDQRRDERITSVGMAKSEFHIGEKYAKFAGNLLRTRELNSTFPWKMQRRNPFECFAIATG